VRAGHGPAVDEQPALIRSDQAAEHAEQGRLAAAGGADQGAERAFRDRERDVVERFDRARAGEVPLGHALDDDQLGARAPVRCRRSRAMTRRWISEVPSPISVSFASRKMRSTGNSVMYPAPPWICTAFDAAFIAVSDENSLAIAAACIAGRPVSFRCA